MTRSGVFAAGNFILDHVKVIDAFPHQDGLANITHQFSANGGSPYNVLKNMALLGASFPLLAAGCLGADADGRAIREDCARHGIRKDFLEFHPELPTSYTDVMTVGATGRRTFFHQRGANAAFDGASIDFGQTREKIFHLGYLLLLDKLDEVTQGVSGAARLLARASEAGLKTSADIVSESSDRFRQIVPPALPHLDWLFVNEYEAAQIVAAETPDGAPSAAWLREVTGLITGRGVREWVFLHFAGGVAARSR